MIPVLPVPVPHSSTSWSPFRHPACPPYFRRLPQFSPLLPSAHHRSLFPDHSAPALPSWREERSRRSCQAAERHSCPAAPHCPAVPRPRMFPSAHLQSRSANRRFRQPLPYRLCRCLSYLPDQQQRSAHPVRNCSDRSLPHVRFPPEAAPCSQSEPLPAQATVTPFLS